MEGKSEWKGDPSRTIARLFDEVSVHINHKPLICENQGLFCLIPIYIYGGKFLLDEVAKWMMNKSIKLLDFSTQHDIINAKRKWQNGLR
ncbi:MAG: hypothetical protein DYG86_00550 [Chloroflexi bacterium CFX2]|nr:hypothetical protein [Chloroflexi bacterium CFX2]